MSLHGSCLCGSIHYQIDGELGDAMFCHCQKCRKANGSAFAFNAAVTASHFKLLSGADLLQSYASSPDAQRYFCKNCGSPLYSQRNSAPEILRLRLGTLDDDVAVNKTAHIFVGSKATWDDIHDDLPQFVERPE
ncbi:GFA family protein [Shewanella sp. C32]|uniref:GFA family protein n=1 Tax=Shewanella electrica TaxID=515560 RepID=A0ABT2FND7_9GAMM|nr:GFA family protein [Shewanella electrica]MCH1924839.1 GFA family protein [Shewanella electrica]MCS4556714.1 GFA family protein [Shewanella electrica]